MSELWVGLLGGFFIWCFVSVILGLLLGPVLRRDAEDYPPADGVDLGADIDGLGWEDIQAVLARKSGRGGDGV